ncbi:MAG TPA: hypothetical protein PKD85_12855 [Saprospiraceae bacterium]|nr:hypothetical protein [Saprospiraceae bacterium]
MALTPGSARAIYLADGIPYATNTSDSRETPVTKKNAYLLINLSITNGPKKRYKIPVAKNNMVINFENLILFSKTGFSLIILTPSPLR